MSPDAPTPAPTPPPADPWRPCPACGYDLRATTTARCPECGTPFDPAAARLSEIPWEYRATRGPLRAFAATVLLVTCKPWKLRRELSLPLSDAAARSFQRTTGIFAALVAGLATGLTWWLLEVDVYQALGGQSIGFSSDQILIETMPTGWLTVSLWAAAHDWRGPLLAASLTAVLLWAMSRIGAVGVAQVPPPAGASLGPLARYLSAAAAMLLAASVVLAAAALILRKPAFEKLGLLWDPPTWPWVASAASALLALWGLALLLCLPARWVYLTTRSDPTRSPLTQAAIGFTKTAVALLITVLTAAAAVWVTGYAVLSFQVVRATF